MQKYYLELHGRNVSAGENFAIGIRLDPCRNTIYTHIVGMSVQEKKINACFCFMQLLVNIFLTIFLLCFVSLGILCIILFLYMTASFHARIISCSGKLLEIMLNLVLVCPLNLGD